MTLNIASNHKLTRPYYLLAIIKSSAMSEYFMW